MLKHIFSLVAACFLLSCTSPPKTPKEDKSVIDASVRLDPQAVVTNCIVPHEVFTFPPQPIPGVPAILSRHGECMGSTNVVVVIWPGVSNRVTLLYVKMLVESYIQHLRQTNEHYNAILVSVGSVSLDDEMPDTAINIVTSAAVFKLVHTKQKDKK